VRDDRSTSPLTPLADTRTLAPSNQRLKEAAMIHLQSVPAVGPRARAGKCRVVVHKH
jgi:hypothetical protein